MEQIRSKPAFPRKATGKTWVFQERQKANQQIAGADKNIDIKTRRPRHRKAQFYISNKSIFNNFLLRLKFSFHDILSVKCKLLHGLLESVNYNRHEVGIVCFNSKSFPILLGCSPRRCGKIYGAVIYFSSDLQFTFNIIYLFY